MVDMEPKKNLSIPFIIGGIVVATAALYWYYALPKQSATPAVDTLDTSVPDVSAEVSGAVETPAEKLPETNPFSDYKNPFE